MTETTKEDIHEAIDRIARTADGQALYLYLQQVRMSVSPPDMADCALPKFEGRRSFAAELMTLMGEGIAASDGRAGSQPIVIAKRHPAVTVSGRQSPREWLAGQPDNPDQPWGSSKPEA